MISTCVCDLLQIGAYERRQKRSTKLKLAMRKHCEVVQDCCLHLSFLLVDDRGRYVGDGPEGNAQHNCKARRSVWVDQTALC